MEEPRSPTPPFSFVVVRQQAHRVLMQSQPDCPQMTQMTQMRTL